MTELFGPNWIPAVLIFGAVGLAVVALALGLEGWREYRRRRDFRRQLKSVTERPEAGGKPAGSVFRGDERQEIPWLEPVLARVPQGKDLQLLLERAAVDWSVSTFLTLCVGFALAAGLGLWILTGAAVPALLGAATGAALPFLHLRRLTAKRIAAFEEQFPEAIDLLGRAIRAGHAFTTGLKMVADETPDPAGTEFRQIFEEQKFGLPLEDSLLGMTDRIDLVDVRIFVTAILVQREVGGNLAEILDQISYTIRERFMIQRQVRVYTAQGRMTGYLLAGLPILVGALIWLLNSEYMRILIEEPVGRFMIGAAAVLQFVGFLVIRRIIDIEI